MSKPSKRMTFDLNSRLEVVPEPLGFTRASPQEKKEESLTKPSIDTDKLLALKKKRAMDMGLAPGKQLFMTAFMLWMAGAGVHIFSIMIVGMSFVQPIKAIASTQAYFQAIAEDKVDLIQPKLLYVALNLLGLGLALYKCSTMGLLPLNSSDWVNWIEPRPNSEISGGGIVF